MNRPRARTIGPLLVALALLAGCTGQPGRVVPSPKRTTAPASRASLPPPPAGDPLAKALDGVERREVGAAGSLVQARLTGTARLISDRGGAIVSDNGGGIISNNSGAIISDNGGGLVSNNGGGLVSNNGGGLTSKTKYALRQTPPTAEFRLADAVVTVHDAAGRALVDAAGSPITATTDATGAYRLEAALPAENLVVRIRLWQGGTLSAMLPKGQADRAIDLDTASSIGASYVLGEFVRGDQAIYDKLPATEADRLRQGLRAAQALVTAAPRYDAAELVAIGEDLRKRDGAVDRTLTDIKALLLGQANLGAGRKADEVPLAAPEALVVDGRGRLLIGEAGFGRVRAVAADGTMTTWVDTAFGEVKRNFFELSDLALGPEGRIYVLAKGALWAVGADGQVAELPLPPGVGSIRVGLAVGPDGTAFVGHAERQRITAVPPQGPAREVPLDGPGAMWGLKAAPDGRLYALCSEDGAGEVWRGTADGVRERVATGLSVANDADLEIAADGTIYVSTQKPAALVAIAPDGTRRVLAGEDAAEPDGRALVKPSTLHLAKDGTLYVADKATAFVHARTAAGAWRRVAGSHARIQDLARGEVSVNGPGGAAFDVLGRLVFTEVASHTVKRFDGQRIETIAGTVRGDAGDGGPATAARLSLPRSVATAGDDVYVLDTDNGRLRRIGADGTISTVAGTGDEKAVDLAPGQDHPPGAFSLALASGLAIGRDGRPVWSTRHQVIRLAVDGTARVLAGRPYEDATKLFDLATLLGAAFPIAPADAPFAIAVGVAADPTTGAVHVSDAGRGQVFRLGDAQVGSVFGIPLVDQLANAGTHHDLPAEAPDAKALAAIVPAGVCFDPQGNLYVAEMGTRQLASASTALGSDFPFDAQAVGVYPARVRKITPDGRVTTIAGPGGRFYTNPDAEDALVLPSGLAFAADGRLAILDAGANSIRILPAGSF